MHFLAFQQFYDWIFDTLKLAFVQHVYQMLNFPFFKPTEPIKIVCRNNEFQHLENVSTKLLNDYGNCLRAECEKSPF